MPELATRLERVDAAESDHRTLEALHDERAQDYDRQARASGQTHIAIAAGRWELLDRSRLFRACSFTAQEAHLRHRVLACRKRRARLNRNRLARVSFRSL